MDIHASRPTFQLHFSNVILISEYSDMPVECVRGFNLGGLLGIAFVNNLLLALEPRGQAHAGYSL